MPRGFLVKRTKHIGAFSHRNRHFSDDDKSESGSDQEYIHTNFGSPDSGYSASPNFVSFRERYRQAADYIGQNSPVSSPLTVSTINYPSPLYYSTFDRLTVCNEQPLDLKINGSVQSLDNETPLDFSITPNKHSRELSKPEPVKSTPISPNKRRGNSENSENKAKATKKPKAARKINFDEDNSSPVSGTIIRRLSDEVDGARIVCGDIDSKFNCVDVTPEAKAEIAKIENRIGDYVCRLCKELFDDAFKLAQHRCSMIINIEYRCPECDKVFNCPANLASHRRWHKPRPVNKKSSTPTKILPVTATTFPLSNNDSSMITSTDNRTPSEERQFSCNQCGKKFRRQAYLRKHQQTHASDSIYVCQFCSKIYPNDNARAKHEITHTGGKELTCTLCNTSFPNKIVLEKHVRQHGNDKFDCKYCDSSFCSSPGLTRHINKCHPSENRQVILLQIPGNRPANGITGKTTELLQ